MLDDIPTELKVAFQRLSKDYPARVPYCHPCEFKFLEQNSEFWLKQVWKIISADHFTADSAPSLLLPKKDFQTRPAVALSLRDQLIYHYLALCSLPYIKAENNWSENTVRFSYRVLPNGSHWFKNRFKSWRAFDKVSIGRASSDCVEYVVVADVSAYYENIDIGKLGRVLQAAGVPHHLNSKLQVCWKKWSGQRGRGIPQVYSPSHVFGEFFLDSIDKALKTEGFEHLRYVDDIRIFAPDLLTARKAQHRLSILLRDKGLNVQSAKSCILSAQKSVERFTQVRIALSKVSRSIGQELQSLAADFGISISPEELDKYFQEIDPEDPPVEVIESAWSRYESGEFGDFDTTLFHYLSNKLKQVKSTAAVSYMILLLSNRPEETEHALRHLEALRDKLSSAEVDNLADILYSPTTLLPMQRFYVLNWFLNVNLKNEKVLAYCRVNVSTTTPHQLTRPQCIEYLGRWAEGAHDWDRIVDVLHQDMSSLGRLACTFALGLAPKPISSPVFSQIQGESCFIDWCLQSAKRRNASN
ncbi:MAG: reverse transcriptase domain-containing protein [Cyanobacteria bacterium J06656_5]